MFNPILILLVLILVFSLKNKETFDWGNFYETNQRGTVYHTKIHPLTEVLFWVNTKIPEEINFNTNMVINKSVKEVVETWTCRKKIGNMMYRIGEHLKSCDKKNSIKSKMRTSDGLYYTWTLGDKYNSLRTIVTATDSRIVGLLIDKTGSEGHYLHYRQLELLRELAMKYGNHYLVNRLDEVKRSLEIKHATWRYIRNKGNPSQCLTKDKNYNTTAEVYHCGGTPPQYQLWTTLEDGNIINQSDQHCLTRDLCDECDVEVRRCGQTLDQGERQKWTIQEDGRIVNRWGTSKFLTKNLCDNCKVEQWDHYSDNDNQKWTLDPPIKI